MSDMEMAIAGLVIAAFGLFALVLAHLFAAQIVPDSPQLVGGMV